MKKCLCAIAALCSLLFFAIALLPTTLSTTYGKNVALRLAGAFYKGKIEVDALSLSWLSGVHVHGLRIQDQQGGLLAECAEINIEKPLLNWAFSWDSFGNITIASPSLFLHSYSNSAREQSREDKKSHSHHKHKAVTETTPFCLPGIQGSISVSNAKIVATSNKKPLATLSDGTVDLSLDLKHTSKGTISAKLSDGATPATPLSLTFSMQGNPLAEGKASFSLNVEELPTAFLGTLVDESDPEMGGLIREGLGSSLSYQLEGSFSHAKADVKSHLKSQNFTSDIEASFLGNTFSLKQGTLLKGSFTPNLFGALSKLLKIEGVSLIKESTVSLENTAPLQFDTEHYAFLAPYNLAFSTHEPVSFLLKDKDPFTMVGSAVITGTTNRGNAAIGITFSSPYPAQATLNLMAVKKESGYSTSLAVAGAWPQLIDHFASFSFSTIFGKTFNAEIKAEVDIDHFKSLSLKGSSSITSPMLQHAASFSFFKEHNSPFYHLSAQGSVTPSGVKGKTNFLAGNQMTFSLESEWNPQKATATISKLSVTSPIVSGEIAGLSLSKEKFSLTSPARFSLHIEKNLFPPLLEGLAQVEIFPCSFRKQKERLVGKPLELFASGSLYLEKFSDPFQFKFPVKIDVEHSKVHIQPTILSQNANVVEGDIALSIPESATMPSANGTISLQDFPVAVLNLLSLNKSEQFLGKNVSAKVVFSLPDIHKKGNQFSLQSQGDFWHVDGDIHLDDGVLTLVGPGAHVEASFTPEYIKFLEDLFKRKSGLSFRKPFTVRASVPSLKLSILPFLEGSECSLATLFSSLKLRALLFLSELEVVSKEKEVARIASLTGELDVDGEKQRIDLSVTPAKPDRLVAPEVALSVKEFMGPTAPALTNASIDGTFKVRSLPLRLMDFVIPGKGELAEQVIGTTCNIQGSISTKKMERGEIQCELSADHARMHLDGAIKDGNLMLNSPLTASLELTKSAGELLFKDVNPLLASAVRSERPISLTIEPRNVNIPLKTVSLNTLTLPKVTVDVGKIVVKNGGALKLILALLKLGQAANSEELNVWLTPLYMQINNGFVNCLRADALVADELHLITWGTADLVRDNLDMIIAIPQETLRRVGVQLVAEHGLQIPVRGSSSNPKIDMGRATAKLAGAGAMSASKDQRIRILGGLIQAAAAVGEEEKPIPAPTTQPFPWQKTR